MSFVNDQGYILNAGKSEQPIYMETTKVATFTGGVVSSAVSAKITRNGRNVTVQVPAVFATNSSAAVITSTAFIPAALRPAADVEVAVQAFDNNVPLASFARLTTAGTVIVYKDVASAVFGTTGSNGWKKDIVFVYTLKSVDA